MTHETNAWRGWLTREEVADVIATEVHQRAMYKRANQSSANKAAWTFYMRESEKAAKKILKIRLQCVQRKNAAEKLVQSSVEEAVHGGDSHPGVGV